MGLKLAAHLSAARRAPVDWLAALWWFIVGKRLRARIRFAALLADTRQAYQLWLLEEPSAPVAETTPASVIVLIDVGEGDHSTFRSVGDQANAVFAVRDGDMTEVLDCVDWSCDHWVIPLYAGDSIAADAVAAYRAAAATTGARIIYADDDLLDRRDVRHSPHFKPAWNAELYRHFDYLAGACMVRVSARDIASVYGSGWVKQLVRSVAEAAGPKPKRLPHILHHRRGRLEPVVPGKPGCSRGGLPKVTVMVPTRNRLDLLSTCIEGLERTDYPDFNVIIVDNGSDDPATLDFLADLDRARYRVLRDDGPFNFSRLNNRAAMLADGDLLCLLNNDTEMIEPDWLALMVAQALRPEVGAVGAQLLYPDGRIQHAGVVVGICGGAAHAHRLLWPDDEGYFRRHALPQFVSAVTAACLLVRRSCYEAVGGLDEDRFKVAFNDVDFCMRLNARGWQSFYEPRATLVHHESVSRGFDRDPAGAARFSAEMEALKSIWRTGDFSIDVDPFHHPQLSRVSELFTLRIWGQE